MSLFAITVISVSGYYNVVEQPNVHYSTSLCKIFCQAVIVTARFEVSRRVVMTQGYCRCTFHYCLAQDQAYIHHCCSEATAAYKHMINDLVHVIQQKHLALFHVEVAQNGVKVVEQVA